MAEPKTDFAVRLLAGINGDLQILEPHFDNIRVESQDFRLAWGLVEVSHGLRTLSSLEIMWPNREIEKVLTNPEVAALVEHIGERPDLQIQGQQKLVSRTLDAALKVIGSRLEVTDVGIHHARDVADLAIKIDTALTKSGKLAPAKRSRSFAIFNRMATVTSPEYPDGVDFIITHPESVLPLFRAMRCVELEDFEAVWNVLNGSLFTGSLTLEGW